MNIGIDLDDTIVNTYDIFLKLINMKYGLDFNLIKSKKMNYDDINKLTENFDKIKKDLFSVLVKSVELKENVVNVLNKLKSDGHKIIFITARNYEDYDDPYKVTNEYLIKNNVPFDKLLVNNYRKDKVCLNENIDLFIDDSTKHCKDVSNIGIKTLQFGAVFNENINVFPKVYDWNQVYTFINSL